MGFAHSYFATTIYRSNDLPFPWPSIFPTDIPLLYSFPVFSYFEILP